MYSSTVQFSPIIVLYRSEESTGSVISSRGEEPGEQEAASQEAAGKEVTGKGVVKQEVTGKEVTREEVTGKEVTGKEVAEQETAEQEMARKEPGEHEKSVGDKQKKKAITFCEDKYKNSRKSKKSIFKKKDAKETSARGGMEVRIIPIHMIIVFIFIINIINIEIIIIITITRYWRVARRSTDSVTRNKILLWRSWSSKHLSGKKNTV